MKFFYLSSLPNPDGQYVVHDRDCPDIPSIYERDYVGPYNTALEALRFISSKRVNATICPRCGCNHEVYILSQKNE